MTRVKLGSWICPSGNSVDVFFRRDATNAGLDYVDHEWDEPPPLRPEDQVYYIAVVRPAVIRLIQEYTERLGHVLVVTL
jgi:hypothetical protein